MDKVRKVNTEIVNEDWIDSGKAKAYIETSASKVQGVEEAFKIVANHAFEYQEAMKTLDSANKPVINMQGLHSAQRLS